MMTNKYYSRYKCNRDDISYDSNRDRDLEELFGSDHIFIEKDIEKNVYRIVLYIVSSNMDHYTEYGIITLLKECLNIDDVQWIVQYLTSVRQLGKNDYIHAANIIFEISMDNQNYKIMSNEAQKLMSKLKALAGNAKMAEKIGINQDENNRLHLKRSKQNEAKKYKYVALGINKHIVNIDIKNIYNAKAVTVILKEQFGFNPDNLQWIRKVSDKSRKFIDVIEISSGIKSKYINENENEYECNLVIQNIETGIKLKLISIPNKKRNNKEIDDHKMNDIPVNDKFMEIMENQKKTEKSKKNDLKDMVYRRLFVFKPKFHEIKKIVKKVNSMKLKSTTLLILD